MAKMQENTDRNLGKESDDIINECMVLSAIQSTELAIETGLRPEPDHHLLQGVTAAPPDRRLSRAGEADHAAAAPRPHGSRHGDERPGVVVGGDGRAAERGHRRHDSRLAHAAPRRRPARGSVRGVRAAAVPRHADLCPERHGVPRLRTHDELHVPGARRGRAGSHPRQDAGVEERRTKGVENAHARGDGLRRERARRVEGRQHRHLAAGHGRGAELPRLHRRRACHDAQGHLRRAGRSRSRSCSTITSTRSTRGRPDYFLARTVSTGHGAWRITWCVVDPKIARLTTPLPCTPRTMRSASVSRAMR